MNHLLSNSFERMRMLWGKEIVCNGIRRLKEINVSE